MYNLFIESSLVHYKHPTLNELNPKIRQGSAHFLLTYSQILSYVKLLVSGKKWIESLYNHFTSAKS